MNSTQPTGSTPDTSAATPNTGAPSTHTQAATPNTEAPSTPPPAPAPSTHTPAAPKTSTLTKVMNWTKLVALVVIAISLVKFAFFPAGGTSDDGALAPDVDFTQSTVVAERGTVSATVTATGTIQQDGAGQLKAPLEGTVIALNVAEGQQVNAGDAIAQIQQQIPGEDIVTTDEEGNQIVMPGGTDYRSQWVTAPVAGTVHLTAVKNQTVSAGDSLGTVQPNTYAVVAQLSADQMYRISNVPDKATVTIKNGPQPFECTGLKIDAKAGTTGTEEGITATNIEARCPIPADMKVFPGLQATMKINAGEATDVLTLPATAVEGRYQKGFVYTVDGEQKEVEIGLTDGALVEIRSGLEEGEEVLEYVPSSDGSSGDMGCDPMTGEGC